MYREGGNRVHPLRGFGLVRVGGASQSLDGVVFVGLAQDVPVPLFNDRAQQATGVVLGHAEGVRNRKNESLFANSNYRCNFKRMYLHMGVAKAPLCNCKVEVSSSI